jgi:NifU-like protein involved in Fe-S cluster formation
MAQPLVKPDSAAQDIEFVAQQMLILRRYIVIQIQDFAAAFKAHKPRDRLSTMATAIVEACRVCYASEAMLRAAAAAASDEAQKIVSDLDDAMRRLDNLPENELRHLFDAVLVENFRSMSATTRLGPGPG